VRLARPNWERARRLRSVSPGAIDRLLAGAERQSEGRVDGRTGATAYFGTTWFGFRLEVVRGAFCGREAQRLTGEDLARWCRDHPLLRLRLLREAREEAERRISAAGGLIPAGSRGEVTVSERGGGVEVEVSLEVRCLPVAVSARRAPGCGSGR
jgi:hypothetical protein